MRRSTRRPAKTVPEEDRVKGYKVADDAYVLLEDEELDEVALESTHTIEIEAFVPRKEVDEIYLDESYYLVPDDKVGMSLRRHPRGDAKRRRWSGLRVWCFTGASAF